MTPTTYLLYLAAVAVLVLSPGPTMLMCMTNAVKHGAGKAMASAGGSVTAVLGVMVLSSLGLGALLAASEAAFTVFKVVGAAYLIYLGVLTFRSPANTFDVVADQGSTDSANGLGGSAAKLYVQGLLVGASNPKALLFFSAFFPQFLDPSAPFMPQFVTLAGTFVACEFGVLSLASLFTARLAPWLRVAGRARWFNRISGGLFTGMGALLLTLRRQA